MSDRFFFDGPLGSGDVTLDGPEAHHLGSVRRLVEGDPVTLFNGDGHEYPALIIGVEKRRVILHVTGLFSPVRELGFSLHIAAALPKGDRGDFLIEKLTELGVTDFTLLITERSVVKPDGSKANKLRRAVIEASKQCGRNVLMRVHAPARWSDWCVRPTGWRMIAHPGPVDCHATGPGAVTVAIGPEGGFTESEVETGVASGWQRLSLGPRILRVETAALAAAVLFGQGLR